VAQFHDFVTRYPKGAYTSTAMLSMALAYTQVKDTSNARDTLKKVVAAYPGTPEATLAEAALKNLEPATAEAHK
jgi:TolA-binding protein